MSESVNGRIGGPCPLAGEAARRLIQVAFATPYDGMFGAPDESRLYGSWQLAEGIRKGLATSPAGPVYPPV